MRCEKGDVIEVTNAWYGLERGECGVDAKRSLDIMCGDNRACQITAMDDQFPTSDCTARTGNVILSYRCSSYSKFTVSSVVA